MFVHMFGSCTALPVIAQTVKKGMTNEDRAEIFFWLAVMVGVATVVSVAGFLIYRKLKNADRPTGEVEGFSLSQMRRLYEAGELSHEEYTQLREKLLSSAKRSMLGQTAGEEQLEIEVHTAADESRTTQATQETSPELHGSDESTASTEPAENAPDHEAPPTNDEIEPGPEDKGP